MHALEEQFGLSVTLDDLLDRLTIRDLIRAHRRVHRRESACYTATASTSPRALPLSANQQSIYAAHRMDPDGAAYHICCAARIDWLDPSRLRQALATLIARYPGLRARVELRDGQPWQVVDDDVDLPWTEVASAEPGIDAFLAAVRPHALRPFVLERAPLWRATLVSHEDAAGPHLLLLTFHHLIADLWSLTIVWRELLAALDAPASEAVPIATSRTPAVLSTDAYAAFVESQAELLNSDRSAPMREDLDAQTRCRSTGARAADEGRTANTAAAPGRA